MNSMPQDQVVHLLPLTRAIKSSHETVQAINSRREVVVVTLTQMTTVEMLVPVAEAMRNILTVKTLLILLKGRGIHQLHLVIIEAHLIAVVHDQVLGILQLHLMTKGVTGEVEEEEEVAMAVDRASLVINMVVSTSLVQWVVNRRQKQEVIARVFHLPIQVMELLLLVDNRFIHPIVHSRLTADHPILDPIPLGPLLKVQLTLGLPQPHHLVAKEVKVISIMAVQLR